MKICLLLKKFPALQYTESTCCQSTPKDKSLLTLPSEQDARYFPPNSKCSDSTAPVWPLKSAVRSGCGPGACLLAVRS